MNDLVRPTGPFGGARVPTIGPSGVLGTVPNPPPQVSRLSAGSTVTGVVVGHDTEGHTLVRTDLGTLSVATKAQLPIDSEVTLQIRSSGGQLHILIVRRELPHDGAKGAPMPQTPQATGAPTGTPAGGAQAGGTQAGGTQAGGTQAGGTQAGGTQVGGTGIQGQAATASGAGQAALAGHGPASDFLTLGQHLRAVVQSPAATPNAAAGGGQSPAGPTLSALAAQLVPGSELRLQIISVQAPAAQATGTQAAGSPALGGPALGGPALGGPAGGAGAGQAGQPAAPNPTPNGPNPATGTPPSPAPAVPTGQGTAPGATPGASAPATATPASGVPAPGAIASYAAAGGSSGTSPLGLGLGPGPGTVANPAALLAAHGIGPGGAAAPAQASQSGAAPGIGITGGTGSGPTAAPASAAPAISAATPSPGAAFDAMQFTGVVTAVTHAGRPILQTPLGTLTLEIRAPLQAGSRIAFELTSGALASFGSGAAGPGPAALGTLAHSWPALEETLQTLREVAPPGVAAAMLRDAIPQSGPRLASGLLFFLSALSGGDVNRWIGNQASQALKSAGRDFLLSRLGQDFGQLGRLADNHGGDWRLFFIPLHDGDQLRQLRLFLRHGLQDREGDGRPNDEDLTRFVVEIEMSRLGDLQLDGLVREKRFDLILRSRAPLPDIMRREITQIFHEANEVTGYFGNIGFQSSLNWKAMPIESPEAAVDSGVVV